MHSVSKSTSYSAAFGVLMGKDQTAGPLEILFGCLPYEVGWLFCALVQPGSTARQA